MLKRKVLRDFADIQKKYEPKSEQLQALNNEINSLAKQLQTQSSMLSETERIQRQDEIQEKQKEEQRTGRCLPQRRLKVFLLRNSAQRLTQRQPISRTETSAGTTEDYRGAG